MLELRLPYPPTLNSYYRHVGRYTLLSRKGREYREMVVSLLANQKIEPLSGPLDMMLVFHPPDRRRRDVDNLQKAILDALQHGGAYHNDDQIMHLDVWKRDPIAGGKAIVRLRQLAVEHLRQFPDGEDQTLSNLKQAQRYLSQVIAEMEHAHVLAEPQPVECPHAD